MTTKPSSYARLRLTSAFQRVYRSGRWVREAHLSAGAITNGLAVTRIGLRTRKGLKGAVLRNRLKRQLRAIVAGRQDLLPRGIDMVLVVHPNKNHLETSQLLTEFANVCQRLHSAVPPVRSR